MPHALFTIGHSTHSREEFIALLSKHAITALVDVRSAPCSKWHPQFNQESISSELVRRNIRDVFLGVELGARRSERECYNGTKADYNLIAHSPLFRYGLERIGHGVEKHRIALMCAEKEPITCHRAILICRRLRGTNLLIRHILETGELETLEDLETRLLALAGLPEQDLFQTREDLLEQAYDWQGDRIAFEQSAAPETVA